MSLVGLLVALIVIGVALYIVRMIPMDPTVQKIITALVLLATVLWLLEGFGVFAGYSHINRFR